MGVILALTGCEATFAKLVANLYMVYCHLTCVLGSLGQFNATSIRVRLIFLECNCANQYHVLARL